MLYVGQRRVAAVPEVTERLRRGLRLRLRLFNLLDDRRRLLLVRDGLRDYLADRNPRVRQLLRPLRKRVGHRHGPRGRVRAVCTRLHHELSRILRRRKEHRARILPLRRLEDRIDALRLADLRKPIRRPCEVAVRLRVLRRGPKRNLRRVRRLLKIAAVVLEFRHDLRRTRTMRLRKHQGPQDAKRIRDVIIAEVFDALVPDLSVRNGRFFGKGSQREKTENRKG